MAIIDSKLVAALCHPKHAPLIPTARHPLPRLLGSTVAVKAPRHLLAGITQASPSRRASKAEPSRGNPLLAAVDCAPHLEPVQNVKPGATSEITFFAVRRAWPRRVGVRLQPVPAPGHRDTRRLEVQRPFHFSDVLSLHYQDRVPSHPYIHSVPDASSCNEAVAYILQFSVERSPIMAPRLGYAGLGNCPPRGCGAQLSTCIASVNSGELLVAAAPSSTDAPVMQLFFRLRRLPRSSSSLPNHPVLSCRGPRRPCCFLDDVPPPSVVDLLHEQFVNIFFACGAQYLNSSKFLLACGAHITHQRWCLPRQGPWTGACPIFVPPAARTSLSRPTL
ncbi:hypothetical protein AURDEDRAFT_177141 [Auricularia subglabra TFB-10046 SS5]|uniref:Uncharacterized protein n=1 Tax=Auricularia subglabra (strain TFB-10046 / SS5) TaxID=717982 RepID=J0WN38_AURST|nr:hypothetical protein AURDEDRAFT_177141 [Auricularia subglabra TFB-10046 SS5]